MILYLEILIRIPSCLKYDLMSVESRRTSKVGFKFRPKRLENATSESS